MTVGRILIDGIERDFVDDAVTEHEPHRAQLFDFDLEHFLSHRRPQVSAAPRASEQKENLEQEATEATEKLEFSTLESSVLSVPSCSILLCAFQLSCGIPGQSPVCVPAHGKL